MRYRLILLTACVCAQICATACALHKPVQPDLATGHIGTAVWPDCKLDVKAGMVLCKCDKFVMELKADGTAIMRCPVGGFHP